MTARQAQAAIRHLRDVQNVANELPRGKRNKVINKTSKVMSLINKQLKQQTL